MVQSESAGNQHSAARFDETLADITHVHGWMTDAQARRLWDRATEVPDAGRIVEIGSFHGRSAIVMARAARPGVEIITIDPHLGSDRGPREIQGDPVRGNNDHTLYFANLARAGVTERIRHVRQPSQRAGDEVDGTIDLLYIDGAHRFGPARADIRSWGNRVRDGGVMLLHDSFSSIGVTGAIATELLASGRFLYTGRVGSMAEYRCGPQTAGARVRSAARQVLQLPWFVRNVIVKVLMLLHLHPLTRLLGHRSDEAQPY